MTIYLRKARRKNLNKNYKNWFVIRKNGSYFFTKNSYNRLVLAKCEIMFLYHNCIFEKKNTIGVQEFIPEFW